MKKYLSKFTDLNYADAMKSVCKSACSGAGETERRTIFLVGPCIVGGWAGFVGDVLSDVLYEKIVHLGLDYKIKNVSFVPRCHSEVKKKLEHVSGKMILYCMWTGFSTMKWQI